MSDGSVAVTIPDLWGRHAGGLVELKNVRELSYTKQLQAQIAKADEAGAPFNLVVSPRTAHLTEPLKEAIREAKGHVFVFDPEKQTLTELLL